MSFEGRGDFDKIILVDKPAGVSSFFVVSRIRRELSEKIFRERGLNPETGKRWKVKVGHTGTLDPFATGLLIILSGKMTKKANEFLKLDKEYIAEIELGKVSSTGDIEGEVKEYNSSSRIFPKSFCRRCRAIPPSRVSRNYDSAVASVIRQKLFGQNPKTDERYIPSLKDVEEVLESFKGEIEQKVPAYSAVKINGQRAYKLAREGKKVEMPVRKVKIYDIEILEYNYPKLKIRCEVSSGTYIRQLGEDIGEKLGVGGYLVSLRRTKIDKYDVKDARKIEIEKEELERNR